MGKMEKEGRINREADVKGRPKWFNYEGPEKKCVTDHYANTLR